MKCAIVSGGDPPKKSDFDKYGKDAELLVAVDGAAGLMLEFGVVPDYLIGDMDTADAESVSRLETLGAFLIRLPREKNETDTEAAVKLAMRLNADDIVILGATGGRFDHTMANLAMLVKSARAGVRCRIIDGTNEMWAATGEHDVEGYIGQTVSIIPLTGDLHVTAAGLYYPLQNLFLGADSSRGVSNTFLNNKAHLSILGGYALIVKIRR